MYTFRRAVSIVGLTSFKANNKALVLLFGVITKFILRKSSHSTLNSLKNRILMLSFYLNFASYSFICVEIYKNSVFFVGIGCVDDAKNWPENSLAPLTEKISYTGFVKGVGNK